MDLKELKQILDNAPEGATHVDTENGYLQFDEFGDSHNVDGQRYLVDVFDLPNTRKLSDIKTIVEQQEEINRLNTELKQQIDNNLTDVKKAFWWSAEFTHVVHGGKIQFAWEDYATRLVKE